MEFFPAYFLDRNGILGTMFSVTFNLSFCLCTADEFPLSRVGQEYNIKIVAIQTGREKLGNFLIKNCLRISCKCTYLFIVL